MAVLALQPSSLLGKVITQDHYAVHPVSKLA